MCVSTERCASAVVGFDRSFGWPTLPSVTDEPPVLLTRDADDPAVVVLTLNRPARYNALTVELKSALRASLALLADADDVRAAVLTGAGKAFCVGQDLGEHAEALAADPGSSFNTVVEHYNPIVTGLVDLPFPTVAAINGPCVGAGLGFAMACDLRVAAAGLKLSTAFTGIGLTADSGLSASLAHAVGVPRAMELLLLERAVHQRRRARRGGWCARSCRRRRSSAARWSWPGGWRPGRRRPTSRCGTRCGSAR